MPGGWHLSLPLSLGLAKSAVRITLHGPSFREPAWATGAGQSCSRTQADKPSAHTGCREAIMALHSQVSRRRGKGRGPTVKARRLLMAFVLACVPLVGAISAAGAVPPTGDCPPAFEGPSSFAKILIDFPPPPGVPLEDVLATLD